MQLFAPYFLQENNMLKKGQKQKTFKNVCSAILTCQLAIALHIKTSELRAPEGFALTFYKKKNKNQAQVLANNLSSQHEKKKNNDMGKSYP